jgi:short-subunit dehydrogenase
MTYRLALVTGATSGIGRGLCYLLAQKGIPLIACGRNAEKLIEIQKDLSPKVKIQTVQADFAQKEDRKKVTRLLHAQVPDLIINNAGFGLYGNALTYSTNEQLEILEVNVQALTEHTLEAARSLYAAGQKGTILNISSVAGFHVLAVYSASKAFVSSFSQALDYEVQSHHIRVLTCCPGMVATNFQKRAGASLKTSQRLFMSVDLVVKEIWQQIEQLEIIKTIPWYYRLLTFFSFFLPTKWTAAIGAKAIAKRIPVRAIQRDIQNDE